MTVVHTAILSGIRGVPITVEVGLLNRLPIVVVVGLPAPAVRETVERVRSAIAASGFEFPKKRVVVNLAPTDVPKRGTHYDLPIALAILVASGQLDPACVEGVAAFGELALNGALRHVRGVLPMVADCAPNRCVVVPAANAAEAREAPGALVLGANDLRGVVYALTTGAEDIVDPLRPDVPVGPEPLSKDDVKGPLRAALDQLGALVAAGKRVLLFGPSGHGKTMLAARAGLYLPTMTHEEALEVTRIASAVGLLPPGDGLVTRRPFRAPHHTVSVAGMIGSANLMPGEMTLAHRGTLFLDELQEFRWNVIEAMQSGLADREIKLTRAAGTVRLPTNFALLASANPCPCGRRGSTQACICSNSAVSAHIRRIVEFQTALGIDEIVTPNKED